MTTMEKGKEPFKQTSDNVKR